MTRSYRMLLVDDDDGGVREEFVTPVLDAAGISWGYWDVANGALTGTDLGDAAATTFWMCGISQQSLNAGERTALGAYLDGGGNLFVSGCEVAYDLGDPSSPNHSAATEQWMADYLHVSYVGDSAIPGLMDGIVGDPIGDGLLGVAPSGSGDNAQIGGLDEVDPGPGASASFTYSGPIADGDACVRWEGASSKTLFMGIGIEGIADTPTRELVIQRILDWFGATTGIDQPQGSAPLVRLAQNVPNPFRPSTSISYELACSGAVSLRIYDVSGRLVRTLVDGSQQAMTHRIEWNGDDDAGRAVASGVYFYRLEAPGVSETRRMVLNR